MLKNIRFSIDEIRKKGPKHDQSEVESIDDNNRSGKNTYFYYNVTNM